MAYQIYNADGSFFATIDDNTLNTTTSVTLVGRDKLGWGSYFDTNFLHLLQHFSSAGAPAAPVTGQVWWNSSAKLLNVYTGSQWKAMSFSSAGLIAPTGPAVGDCWFDTGTNELKAWDGSNWVAIGPSVINGTGAVTDTLTDTGGNPHNVIKLMTNNHVVGVVSEDTFVPNTAIAGITSISPGINLSCNIGGNGNSGIFRGCGVAVSGSITGSRLSVTGNVDANNVNANNMSATGNITANNLGAVNSISTAGNVTANYLFGNSAFITGGYTNAIAAAYLASNTVTTPILTTDLISTAANVSGNYLVAANTVVSPVGLFTPPVANPGVGAHTFGVLGNGLYGGGIGFIETVTNKTWGLYSYGNNFYIGSGGPVPSSLTTAVSFGNDGEIFAKKTTYSSSGGGSVSLQTPAVAANTVVTLPSTSTTLLGLDDFASNQSLANSGYQVLPGGLTLQWGTITQSDTGAPAPFTWIFPIPFANNCLQAYMTIGSNISLAAGYAYSVEALTPTVVVGFTNAPTATRMYRMFAIGN